MHIVYIFEIRLLARVGEKQRLHALHEATSADLGPGEPKRGSKEPQMDLGGGRLAVHHMGAAGVHRLGYWWGDSGKRACAAQGPLLRPYRPRTRPVKCLSIVNVPAYMFEFLTCSYFTVLVQYEISII